MNDTIIITENTKDSYLIIVNQSHALAIEMLGRFIIRGLMKNIILMQNF